MLDRTARDTRGSCAERSQQLLACLLRAPFGQVGDGQSTNGTRLLGNKTPMVIELSEMIGQVDRQVHQEVTRTHRPSCNELWIWLGKRVLGQCAQALIYRSQRGIDLSEQF